VNGSPQPVAEFLALDRVTLRLAAGARAFARTSWTWHQGEQWAILGPDGSGKSLLVQALCGELPLAAGEVRGPFLPGATVEPDPVRDVVRISPETQRRVVLSQSTFYQSRWHSGLTEGHQAVSEFLAQDAVEDHNPFEVNPPRGDRREFVRRRRQYVRWLGLQPLWRRRLAHLSNGEMRKTLLVQALLRAPRLLILEDPFAGLDAATRRTLTGVVARLIGSGWHVLVVTHRAQEIPKATTHLLLVQQGRIVAQGPKREMLRLWQQQSERAAAGSRSGAQTRVRRKRQARLGHPIIELRRVNIVGHGKVILCDITWTLRQGECWLILGPNGAGKTTLLNLIQGDHPQAYSQSIRWFGRDTDSTQALWRARQRLGWMSPELHQHYPPAWPVIDVVLSGLANSLGLHEHCSRRQRAAAWQVLRDFGLAPVARRHFGDLTFGEQRLVLLARAVAKRPDLLILDEACQGLDSEQRSTFLAAVDRAVAQAGASLMFVTHRAQEVPRCITHLLRLERGRITSIRAISG
jgi:molybdate transport system ATP-binding protein